MEDKIKMYLLGNLPESERTQLEEDYLSSKDLQEQIDLAEDDLVYAYAHNELSKAEHKQFEDFFLNSPKRQQKLRLAKAVVTYVSTKEPAKALTTPNPQATKSPTSSWWQAVLAFFQPQSPAWQFSMAAVVLMLLVGGIWLISENLRLRKQVESLQSEKSNQPTQNTTPQPKIEENKVASNPSPTPTSITTPQPKIEPNNQIAKNTPPPSLAFTLTPITVRDSGGVNEFSISDNTEIIKLRLDMDLTTEYPNFQVDILTAEGSKIFTSKQLKAQQAVKAKYLVLTLPAKTFKSGDYLVKLNGIGTNKEVEDVADYSFSILRK